MAIVLESLAKIVFMFLLIMGMVPALIWAERKGAAYIQDRTGPNRASIGGVRLAGLVHPIADVLKLVFKEDVAPTNRHRALYALAPWVVMTVAVSTYAVIPFGDYLTIAGRKIPLVVADLQVGLLYVLAVASLGTYGIVLAGWAANNKFTFLGGIRATAQMISYEINMGLAIMGLMLIFGSLRLTDIVAGQGGLLFGWLPMWGVVLQPLGFVLFITSVYAETNRNPFDLPEGESEIVAGYFTEYSGTKFAAFYTAEFVAVVVVAGVLTTVFFGGWQVPWLHHDGWHFGETFVAWPRWAIVGAQIGKFVSCLVFFSWLQLMIRWTLPRFRYDQLMTLGWKVLLPLTLLNILATGLVLLLLQGPGAA